MKNLFSLTLFMLISTIGMAQAPGGVDTGLQLWLKADSGTSTGVDGQPINSWQDQSASGDDAIQVSVSSQPLYKLNQINGNPALLFSGSEFLELGLSGINNQDYSIFVVAKRTSGDDKQYILGIQQSDDDDGMSFGYVTSSGVEMNQYGSTAKLAINPYDSSSEMPAILIGEFDDIQGKKMIQIYNGVSDNKKNSNTVRYYLSGTGSIGRGNGTELFNGLIAEVIIYDRVLTSQELKKLHSYLCIKYGISIPISQSLYYSNGSYSRDLFGIGKSSSQGINQLTSTSVNTQDILTIYGASDLDNDEFLMAGNNGGTLSFEDYVGLNCSFEKTLERTWNITKTGDPGTFSVKFDLSGISGIDPEKLMLVIDRNGNGFHDDYGISGVYNAPFYTVTGITIANSSRMSLAMGKNNWYAVESGSTSDAIWASSPDGIPQLLPSFCEKANMIITANKTVSNEWSNLMCNRLTIESGAIFNAGNSSINIAGDFVMNGHFNSQTSTITMKGPVAQTISGSGSLNVHNLTANNTNGVYISSNSGGLFIRNYLYVNTGVLYTSNKLTLISDATTTGMITPLNGGSIDGDVTVQRYSNRTKAGWYMLACPIQNATVQEWNDDLVTTGFSGSDFPPPGYTFNNMRYYEESIPGDVNNGFVGVTHISDTLKARKGYFVYMNSGIMNLDATGTIYSGEQNMPVSYTDNGSPTNDGWNLLANPYPCAIDWLAPSWTKSNINNAIYVWDPATNQYASYVNGVGTNGGSRYIPSSQSFFVVANAASPSLILQENCKSLVKGTYKSIEASSNHLFTLSISNEDYYDETTLLKSNEGSLDFDSQLDAYKLRSPMTEVPYLSTISQGGHDLSINTFSSLPSGTVIPLRIEVGETGVYTISHNGLESFANGRCVTLDDLLTGESYALNQQNDIKLSLSAGNNQLRFQLSFTGAVIAETTNSNCAGLDNGTMSVLIDQNGPYDLVWYNQNGDDIHSVTELSDDYVLTGLMQGMYSLQTTNHGICGTTSVDFYIGVDSQIEAEATVHASTCRNSADGAVTLNIQGGDGNYSVLWNNSIITQNLDQVKAGEYIAFVNDSKGCKSTIAVTVPSVNNLTSSFDVLDHVFELKNGAASVEFYNTSTDAESFTWNFGDNTIESRDSNPTHIYNRIGIYDVVLTASNGDCSTQETKTIKITRAKNNRPEFASDIIGTLTDEGAQLMFFFNEPQRLRISAYNVLGQQLVEPITGIYERQTIHFSERKYASNALIEILNLETGERAVLRLAQ